jgi:ribonuclease Z
MTSLELPLAELDTVILSHLHVDHIGGLDQLWIGGWVYCRAHPLTVWGTPGTSEFCDHFVKA